jgi:hypothetical protein
VIPRTYFPEIGLEPGRKVFRINKLFSGHVFILIPKINSDISGAMPWTYILDIYPENKLLEPGKTCFQL